MARWQIDGEAADLASLHRGQRGGDDFDMPIHRQLGLRIELMKTARGEGGELLPQHGLVLGARQVLNHRTLVCCRAAVPSAARWSFYLPRRTRSPGSPVLSDFQSLAGVRAGVWRSANRPWPLY
jgi:hypothetical protein